MPRRKRYVVGAADGAGQGASAGERHLDAELAAGERRQSAHPAGKTKGYAGKTNSTSRGSWIPKHPVI